MTNDKLIEEAFKAHEDAPAWDDNPIGRDAAIRWHMRGFNDAKAVFEKAHAPTDDERAGKSMDITVHEVLEDWPTTHRVVDALIEAVTRDLRADVAYYAPDASHEIWKAKQ